MINNSDEFSRRILTFPAIRPSESVSFRCLLSSLIKLGRSICSFKSRTFFTNQKNATNSIHLIETLLVFLEDIRATGDSRSETSMVLALSELHFIFQKVRFLLEDCSRDGARLWMLMKSEEVTTHFRVLMRAVAVALDVLPLSESDMEFELRELAEFVRKRALKSGFQSEKDDRSAVRSVVRILDHFEGGIEPDFSDLKRVFEHLGICSWFECHDEIRFLDSEFGKECKNSEKRNVGFLSSLMAMMIYCRCTLFLKVESVRNGVLHKSDDQMIMCLNVDDFRCPISLEIMNDPVTLSTGHTYDRSSILRWFKSGNHTCPKTGEKLVSVDVVQNLALKRLIRHHCQENGIPFDESNGRNRSSESRSLPGGAGSVVAEQAMALLSGFLVCKLVGGTDEEKNKVAYEIRLLTKTSIFNRSCLVEAGVIPPLLALISSRNLGGEVNAMAALLNLSKYSKSKRIIVENGGLERIVEVLNGGVKMEARQHAAGAFFYLASVEENRRTIGRIPGAILGLIELVRNGSDHAKKNALVAILGLLMHPENHWRILGGGLVQLLVNLIISSEREDLTTDSLAILASLAEKLDGAMAIVRAGVLPIAIEILSSSSNSRVAKECSVSLLLSLCINDGVDVIPLLVKNTSLMGSLYFVLADGTSRSSKKASSLIKILHAYDEKRSMASTVSREQFVREW